MDGIDFLIEFSKRLTDDLNKLNGKGRSPKYRRESALLLIEIKQITKMINYDRKIR